MIQTNAATSDSQHAANIDDVPVSVYHDANDNKGKTMRLGTVMQCIVSGDSPYGHGETVRAMADRLRRMRKGSPEHTTMKKQIPCFIPQGVFAKRGKAHIKTPAELMVIDIDNLQSMAEAEAYRDGLRDDPHVYAAFVSPSGNGVKILVRTDGLRDDAAMKRAFPIMAQRYGEHVSADESGKDISRLCFLSYDPDMWINPQAVPFPIPADDTAKAATASTQREPSGLTLIHRAQAADGAAADIIQFGINALRKADRDKQADAGVSRHVAMLGMQTVVKSRLQAEGIADETPVRDALRAEYAAIMAGDAERVADFDRAWKGAKAFHIEPTPSASPKAQHQNMMPRDRMGRAITPAEMVLYGDPLPADRYDAMLAAATIDVHAKYERPPVLFAFDGEPLLTAQNISVISGKAKSRKSQFAAIMAAMVINPNSHRSGEWLRMRKPRLTAERPYQRAGVLLFDTEQATYHASAMARRILYMAGRDDGISTPLRTYALRDFHPSDRMMFIAETIARHADTCSLIIIDGVRDVVLNINSEDEATLMNSWLLAVTKRHNVHIACVLHENKGTDTLRGHIGTELMNKSEAVFTVTKGTKDPTKALSAVETTYARNLGMDKIGIETVKIDHTDGPMWFPALIDDDRAASIGGAKEGKTADDAILRPDQGLDIIRAIWGHDPTAEILAADLRDAIRVHAREMTGRHIGVNAGKDVIADWLNIRQWIADNGRSTRGRAYRLKSPSLVQSDAQVAAQAVTAQMDLATMIGGADVPF
jgi:hypothetical protein